MPPTVRPLADFSDVPLVDIQALRDPSASARSRHQVAAALGQACREVGFFYIVGHGIDEQLFGRLEDLSHSLPSRWTRKDASPCLRRPSLARLFSGR